MEPIFERLIESFHTPIGLGMEDRGPDVSYALGSEIGCKVIGQELGAIVCSDCRGQAPAGEEVVKETNHSCRGAHGRDFGPLGVQVVHNH